MVAVPMWRLQGCHWFDLNPPMFAFGQEFARPRKPSNLLTHDYVISSCHPPNTPNTTKLQDEAGWSRPKVDRVLISPTSLTLMSRKRMSTVTSEHRD